MHLSNDSARKIRFLSAAQNYPQPTTAVTLIETHHAWVFLTDEYAYKMKRPTRYAGLDLSSLAQRQHLCDEELRLNQALAADTYLGVVALVVRDDGALAIDGDGRVIDWLIKMRRLPDSGLLPTAAARGDVSSEDVARVLRKLFAFYDRAPACEIGGVTYAQRLRDETARTLVELQRPVFALPAALIGGVFARLDEALDARAGPLDARQRDGHVRDVHGDLRPEHICLLREREPQIIDRLEFAPPLRCLDYAEELAYLGIECRYMGQPWIELEIMRAYREWRDDGLPAELWQCYAARRAVTRAKICARHTADGIHPQLWLARSRDYLAIAADCLDAAGA